MHIDLKTAFLQCESYDDARDVVCQLPPEPGLPSYIGARLKKPAYGMNDAPRRWWNRVDKVLLSLDGSPTRADRCCYVFYSSTSARTARQQHTSGRPLASQVDTLETAMAYLTEPVAGSPARGLAVLGTISLHVDDMFCAGNETIREKKRC